MADLVVQQLCELEWVCEASEQLAEAAFWCVQRDIFIASRARHERRDDDDEGGERRRAQGRREAADGTDAADA
eukprot:6742505-Prymnesium_polylepis.1